MKKEYLLPLGDRGINPPGATDELLSSKISLRKRKEIDREDEKDQAKHDTEMAELKKRKAVAENVADKVEKPAEQPSGIKTTGEFNIGNYNLMEIAEKREQERDALRVKAEEEARTQAGITETLRQQLHASEMAAIKAGFEYQMETMTSMINAYASKGNFMDEYNRTKELATQMGMIAPGGASSDMQTQVALKKMEFEQTLELRRYAREEKRADREFQRQLKKDEIEVEFKREESKRQGKRDEMFSSAPEVIGRVLAQGYADKAQDQASSPVEGPPANGKKVYAITADPGESGEVPCPECKRPIGIGGTATTAVCSNPDCGTRLNIGRRGEPARAGASGEEEEE